VTLDAGVAVPGGLTVAHGQDAGDLHGGWGVKAWELSL
jgi:hypothetical protein